ncbi:molecular chaperone [Gluconacetobacter tumulisoli]|uniref:Molecular chaperone n=2 Tax=Gluconacetobacter tumulisoli TaxID=1286189 RepID=A0A7W4K567_9PROT|nr:molecular chaperone [Gluconacetobacter tumulisoli]
MPARALAGMLAAALLLASWGARAGTSIVIWPIDPVITADRTAAALWLENRGRQPALMQVRLFRWDQDRQDDRYHTQADLIGSPPMVQIAPGARQLVRLIRTADLPPRTETAYRIIVDEVPIPGGPDASGPAGRHAAAITFQMRYSIPLFVYGDGLGPQGGRPALDWRIVTDAGRPVLEVRNQGPIHARLTRVAFRRPGGSVAVADGLLGYVLAHGTMRWPLAAPGASIGGQLVAVVNGAPQASTIPQRH